MLLPTAMRDHDAALAKLGLPVVRFISSESYPAVADWSVRDATCHFGG